MIIYLAQETSYVTEGYFTNYEWFCYFLLNNTYLSMILMVKPIT